MGYVVMKELPISTGLMVKLGLAVGAGLALYMLTRKAGEAISTTFDAVGEVMGDVVEAVNPVNPNNLAYKSVNAVGAAINKDADGAGKNADGSWTLGGWFYDVMHGDQINYRLLGKQPKF